MWRILYCFRLFVSFPKHTLRRMQSYSSLGLQWQAVRADGEGAAPAENVDTETDYLERRAADLREVQFSVWAFF